MFDIAILRRYALSPDPTTALTPSRLLTHTPTSLTIFDNYPKSIFHFLVLPRILPQGPLTSANLKSLRTLLRADKNLAKRCLEDLAKDAKEVRDMIEDEMVKRYGFKWPIWTGFHAIQSMEQVFLHLL